MCIERPRDEWCFGCFPGQPIRFAATHPTLSLDFFSRPFSLGFNLLLSCTKLSCTPPRLVFTLWPHRLIHNPCFHFNTNYPRSSHLSQTNTPVQARQSALERAYWVSTYHCTIHGHHNFSHCLLSIWLSVCLFFCFRFFRAGRAKKEQKQERNGQKEFWESRDQLCF